MNMLSWSEIFKLYEKLIRKFGSTYGIRGELPTTWRGGGFARRSIDNYLLLSKL